MTSIWRSAAGILAGLSLSLSCLGPMWAQAPAPSGTARKEGTLMKRARGTFEVKLTPQTIVNTADAATLGRLSIDKQFHGDLEGTSKGEMLTGGTAIKNSAGYVAIERVTGTLDGRKGTFVLQHSGTMNRGEPQLAISVVPDSGTDQLEGLSGTMAIIIAEGKHSYDFEYTIATR